ncbi:MAG: hypothetical protein V4501_07925 [Pseudomonadota bacterium]
MLVFAIVLFLFAAMLGVVLLLSILKNHKTNKALAVLHGSLGGFGLLVALTYLAIGTITPLYLIAIGILLVAICLGFILFGIDISNLRIPKWLALLHPLFAVTGVVVLIVYMTRHTG